MADKPKPKTKPLITVAPPPKLRVGINYPWWGDKYGIFLGDNTIPWESDLEQMLAQYAKMEVKIVRVFLLANLHLYGTVVGSGPTAVFTPPPSCPFQYIDGTVRLLKILKKTGARGILSLVDFPAFCTVGGGCTHRHSIITTPGLRQKFFDDVLEALLVESLPFKEQILAWEVMNEPLWATHDAVLNPGATLGTGFGPLATLDQMIAFLKDGLSRIEARGFTSTVGHATIDDLGDFPTGTMPQFHFYPAFYRGSLVSSRAKTNSIVGEISSRFARDPPSVVPIPDFLNPSDLQKDAMERPWSELDGKDKVGTHDAVLERLKLLDVRGYRLALLWPNDDGNTSGFDKLGTLANVAISDYNALP